MPSAWASVRSSTVRARAVEQSPNALDDIEQELQQASAMSEGAAPQAPDAAVPSTAATTPPVAAAPASPPIGGLPDWAQQAKAINLPDVHISVFAPQLADTDWGVGDPVVIDVAEASSTGRNADGTLVRLVEGIRVTIYTVPDARPDEFRRALERARPALVARGAGHVYDALAAVAGGTTETTVAQAATAAASESTIDSPRSTVAEAPVSHDLPAWASQVEALHIPGTMILLRQAVGAGQPPVQVERAVSDPDVGVRIDLYVTPTASLADLREAVQRSGARELGPAFWHLTQLADSAPSAVTLAAAAGPSAATALTQRRSRDDPLRQKSFPLTVPMRCARFWPKPDGVWRRGSRRLRRPRWSTSAPGAPPAGRSGVPRTPRNRS